MQLDILESILKDRRRKICSGAQNMNRLNVRTLALSVPLSSNASYFLINKIEEVCGILGLFIEADRRMERANLMEDSTESFDAFNAK